MQSAEESECKENDQGAVFTSESADEAVESSIVELPTRAFADAMDSERLLTTRFLWLSLNSVMNVCSVSQ